MNIDKLTDIELETDDVAIIKMCEAIRELPDKEIESPSVGSFIEWASNFLRNNKEKLHEEIVGDGK